MKNLNMLNHIRDTGVRVRELYGSVGNKHEGVFMLPALKGQWQLKIIASSGLGWDHVSVSLPDRTPTWEEMSLVKRVFFLPTEVVMQLHPSESEYVNHHPFCLHLWRPHAPLVIPLPDPIMVGPKS
jgi:hypothetical protein